MKKLTTLLTMALIALMSFTLTSCDEDADIADTLYGTWKGYMDIGLKWDNRYYESTTSEITFNTNGNYTDHGDGYWIDRYSNAPWDYVANHIEWYVSNRTIKIHFMEEDTYATIRDYSLDDDYFYGTIVSGDSKADFRMVKTVKPSRWDYYWYGTNDWYNSWGYNRNIIPGQNIPSRSADKQNVDSVPEMIRMVHGGK